jgi:putative flippase GtrA
MLKIHSEWKSIFLFLAVGFLGFCLNITILTIALWVGIDVKKAIVMGITASTLLLFFIDRSFVFSYASHKAATPQLFGFIMVCIAGGELNYLISMSLLTLFPSLLAQIAETVGIIVGVIFNYIFLRLLVFKK